MGARAGNAMEVRRIDAQATRPLRHRVLRPHQRVEDVGFAHDDDDDVLHAGAFVGGALVGVATIHREALDGRDAWRLRGMATDEGMRGRGCGAALVAACVAHVVARGGALVWCNARVSAAGFYEALGFERRGAPFEIAGIGPHVVMTKRVG